MASSPFYIPIVPFKKAAPPLFDKNGIKKDLYLQTESTHETPGLFTVASTRVLPEVVLEREQEGPGTGSSLDRLDSLGLSVGVGNGDAVGVALGRPAALQVDSLLAVANVVKEVELADNKLTGLAGGNLRVEEAVNIGTDHVNDAADRGLNIRLLPDVERLGNGVRASVRGAGGLDCLDKGGELRSSADTVHEGLVTDDKEVDKVPAGPAGKVVNLLLDVRVLSAAAATGLDEDTSDNLDAVLLASRGDALEGVAVSAVDTDVLEAVLGEKSNVFLDLLGRLALAGLAGVAGVGDAELLGVGGRANAAIAGRLLGLLGGLGLLGLRSSRGGRLRLGHGLGSRLRLGLRHGLGSAGRQARAGVGADGDKASLGDGHNSLRASVGAGDNGGGRGVDNDSLLGANRGRWVNGVGASAGADVLSHANGAGGNVASGLDRGNGAGHSGGSLDDGRDTAVGVSARGHLGRGGSADGGGSGNRQSRGREGVGAGRRAGLNLRGRDDNDDLSCGRGRGRGDGLGCRVGVGGGHGGDRNGDDLKIAR